MRRRLSHPLVTLSVIVALSALVAVVLGYILSSVALVESGSVKLGGPIAAFVVTFAYLTHRYSRLEKTWIEHENQQDRWRSEAERLRQKLSELEDGQASQQLSTELARTIATLFANKIVKEAEGDPTALHTLHNETRQYLPLLFRWADAPWNHLLVEEFTAATRTLAHDLAGLADWEEGVEEEEDLVSEEPAAAEAP